MARGGRLLVFAAATLAGALAACSLLDGLDADYTLKRSTPDDEGGSDGAIGADGPTGTDSGSDGPLVPPDGDASIESDAAFCELHGIGKENDVTFCWDFEAASNGGPKFGWTDGKTDNGTTDVESNVGVRGSKGFHATVSKPPVTGNASVSQLLTDPFNSYTHHELSFSYAVKTKSTLYTASIGAIGYGSSLMGISVYKGSMKDVVDISDPPGMSGGAGGTDLVDMGAWRRARIVMDRTDAGTAYATTITISDLDGSNAVEIDKRTGFAGGSAPTVIYVGAFFTSNDANGAVETLVDDVLLKQRK